MTTKRLSQREVADLLRWSQSRVAKLLTGRVEMSLDDLEGLLFAVNLNAVEVLRDRGLEFFAEMTPSEVRVLERVRQNPETLQALTVLLGIGAASVRKRPTVGRPLLSKSQRT